MKMMPYEQARLIRGRNFIETLILTHEEMLLKTTPVEKLYESVQSIETLICAFSLISPDIADEYAKGVKYFMRMNLPHIPEPELKGCFILDQVKNYLLGFGSSALTEKTTMGVDEKIKLLSAMIVKASQYYVFIKLGYLLGEF